MKKFFNRALWSLLTSFFAIWLAIALIGEAYALKYASTINNILNINPYEVVGGTDPEPIYQSKYLKSDGSYNDALMRTVPGFEHCSAYVLSRINSLASSSFLATHLGDKGDRWHDREWTTDLPSDNQIVMHIFSAWISFFLSGKRKGKDQLLFSQKYLFVILLLLSSS